MEGVKGTKIGAQVRILQTFGL